MRADLLVAVLLELEGALPCGRIGGVERPLGETPLARELTAPAAEWIAWSLRRIEEHRIDAAMGAQELAARLGAIAERAERYVARMDFRFLFDEEHELFSIGYQFSDHTLDTSFYDLFASESRLASFVAIAKKDVPVEHWFRLGRSLTLDPDVTKALLDGTATDAPVPVHHTGIRLIDSLTELTYYTVNMWRMGKGKEPKPNRNAAVAVATYMWRHGIDAVRQNGRSK